jgi:hypothetical protein
MMSVTYQRRHLPKYIEKNDGIVPENVFYRFRSTSGCLVSQAKSCVSNPWCCPGNTGAAWHRVCNRNCRNLFSRGGPVHVAKDLRGRKFGGRENEGAGWAPFIFVPDLLWYRSRPQAARPVADNYQNHFHPERVQSRLPAKEKGRPEFRAPSPDLDVLA